MISPGGGFDQLEVTIGRVLRIGTRLSTVCLAAGLTLAIAGVAGGVARALLGAGLLILLATPGARVVVSVVGYVKVRDWLFVALTSIVLLGLAASVAAAFWGP